MLIRGRRGHSHLLHLNALKDEARRYLYLLPSDNEPNVSWSE